MGLCMGVHLLRPGGHTGRRRGAPVRHTQIGEQSRKRAARRYRHHTAPSSRRPREKRLAYEATTLQYIYTIHTVLGNTTSLLSVLSRVPQALLTILTSSTDS